MKLGIKFEAIASRALEIFGNGKNTFQSNAISLTLSGVIFTDILEFTFGHL